MPSHQLWEAVSPVLRPQARALPWGVSVLHLLLHPSSLLLHNGTKGTTRARLVADARRERTCCASTTNLARNMARGCSLSNLPGLEVRVKLCYCFTHGLSNGLTMIRFAGVATYERTVFAMNTLFFRCNVEFKLYLPLSQDLNLDRNRV